MIVKIGGIEIERGATQVQQLSEALQEQGVDTVPEVFSWMANLPISERVDLSYLFQDQLAMNIVDFIKTFM